MKTTNQKPQWEKLRPEIVDGILFFFDDSVGGDYPVVYSLEELIKPIEKNAVKKAFEKLELEKKELEKILKEYSCWTSEEHYNCIPKLADKILDNIKEQIKKILK